MKKFSIIILSILFISFNLINARNLASFTPLIDKKVAKMETTKEKVEWLKSFSDLLNSPRFVQDKNAWLFAEIRDYSLNMLRVFEYELKEEQAKSGENTTSTIKFSTINLPHLSDNFSNIDEQQVRNAILSWHNEERNNIGVNYYTYNLDLEGSATTRATKLADSHKIKNLHLRNEGDGYYNYNSISNWFSNLGINFPKSTNGGSCFSETIGYGTYRCTKSDCTQNLIDSIKKTWTNLIMKERSYNGDHYRAATMKHFTQMGAGIAIDKSNNRYYIVIHYGINF